MRYIGTLGMQSLRRQLLRAEAMAEEKGLLLAKSLAESPSRRWSELRTAEALPGAARAAARRGCAQPSREWSREAAACAAASSVGAS
mgnify:CR=1 FL=1